MPLSPDLDRARRFVASRPPPGALLHVGLVGAHYYGFPSADSDLDLKGMHLAPTRAVLGLTDPPETHDTLEIFEGDEHDLTTHEARQALSLLLKGNGNVLERIFTPLQLFEGEDLEALRALAKGAISQRFFGHYRGYFGGMCREHARAPRAKSMLYAYRVALTGVHLLKTGEVRGDVLENAREHGFDGLEELVAYKRGEGEKTALPETLDAEHRARWPALERALEDARAKTALPEEPSGADAIDAWLIERRLASLA
ncbi:MAG: nucleotidyltransferase domain-containing protein [Myxococcota bacterium]|nr:nucleotidyltransferase domain-containing protein [Myxococcota bacterium]